MSKTISEIYKEYKIMPALQDHMYRVAAVAALICDNFDGPLAKKEIITVCLLHDLGNIIKSRLEYFPEFNEPEGIEYWQDVQNYYKEKYGADEHKATREIMKELGVADKLIDMINQIDFSLLYNHSDSNDFFIKIIIYADNRVDPHGVVSYDERMNEAKKRYGNWKNLKRTDEERQKLIASGKEIEKQIFAKCKIRPEDINNQTVIPIVSSLRNFVIK